MKRMIFMFSLLNACIACNSLTAQIPSYKVINPVQEKVRIILKQFQVTYNWLDTLYAARERYYLSGIALDYIRKEKNKCTTNKECHALIQKLESVVEKLHVLDLSQKDFEKIQCAAQPFIQLPHFAVKCPAVVIA